MVHPRGLVWFLPASSFFIGLIGHLSYALDAWQTAVNSEAANRWLIQERWSSVGGIAANLGVKPDSIYVWITRKKMPAHKLGRLWKFLATEVGQWVKVGRAANDVIHDSPSGRAH